MFANTDGLCRGAALPQHEWFLLGDEFLDSAQGLGALTAGLYPGFTTTGVYLDRADVLVTLVD